MIRTLLFFSLVLFGQVASAEVDYAELASPLVGTDSEFSFSNGNVYPAVAAPFGMTFWTPRTGDASGWIYQYKGDRFKGFQATHQPSPWIGDYGGFLIMPVSGEPPTEQPAVAFTHDKETSRPHYYGVSLEETGVEAEMTATERCAVMRFTFPADKPAYLYIEAYGGDEVEVSSKPDAQRFEARGVARDHRGGVAGDFGCRFVLRANCRAAGPAFAEAEHIERFKALEDPRYRGTRPLIVPLELPESRVVELKIGTSFIDPDHAGRAIDREIGDRSFDQVLSASKAVWNKRLSQIEIEGATDSQRITFYSNLYRALLFPRILHEVAEDGSLVHYSPYTGEVEPGEMYADNGFWDTFRAVYPFLSIVDPEINASMIRGWINAYKEGGWFPKWASPGYRDCMIGTHVESVVADALCKGIDDFDIALAAEASIKDATAASEFGGYGRKGIEHYLEKGYVACDHTGEATARTLEFAYDDWSVAQVCRYAGREDMIPVLLQRAQNYRNVFDPAVGMMRGRRADGSWLPDFKIDEWGGPFTEGSSWHYSWSVLHDMPGLIELMGGEDAFAAKLDEMLAAEPTFGVGHYGFEIHEMTEMVACRMGQYAHGNQPVHHVLYLYGFAGKPWKTAAPVRQVVDTLYGPGPDGYCGDEDNGQMAAWYLFSTLGFYPVCPGKPGYVVGSPRFAKTTIHLPTGEDLVITAPGVSDEAIHVGSIRVDGEPITRSWIRHKEIARGGEIEFRMQREPNRQWAVGVEDRPFGDWSK